MWAFNLSDRDQLVRMGEDDRQQRTTGPAHQQSGSQEAQGPGMVHGQAYQPGSRALQGRPGTWPWAIPLVCPQARAQGTQGPAVQSPGHQGLDRAMLGPPYGHL